MKAIRSFAPGNDGNSGLRSSEGQGRGFVDKLLDEGFGWGQRFLGFDDGGQLVPRWLGSTVPGLVQIWDRGARHQDRLGPQHLLRDAGGVARGLDRKQWQKSREEGNAVYNVVCLRVKTEILDESVSSTFQRVVAFFSGDLSE
jgi:hypothetical protein